MAKKTASYYSVNVNSDQLYWIVKFENYNIEYYSF